MSNPNRTTLLQLKEKVRAVGESLAILKARRQALVAELLKTARPFLRSRQLLRERYAEALTELAASRALEGEPVVAALVEVTRREFPVALVERNILGVRYREIAAGLAVRRPVEARNYDFYRSTARVEEASDRFEQLAEAMLPLAAFEHKVQRLGEEIIRLSRKTRVLEERVQPGLSREIKEIAMYIAEREREEYFRLKRFKQRRRGRGGDG
ncbi:MAG: V-type ATP synthase subunit D [Thermodesulfobacteriota bacterium]